MGVTRVINSVIEKDILTATNVVSLIHVEIEGMIRFHDYKREECWKSLPVKIRAWTGGKTRLIKSVIALLEKDILTASQEEWNVEYNTVRTGSIISSGPRPTAAQLTRAKRICLAMLTPPKPTVLQELDI